MPYNAAMATTARHRRSRRSGATTHHSTAHGQQPLKPIIPPILLPPLPPLPREDKPADAPRKPVPLVKTQYNTKRLRRLSILGGTLLVLAIGVIVILNVQRLIQASKDAQSKSPQYQLNVRKEKLDEGKAQLIMQQIRQATAQAVAQSSASAKPTQIPGQLTIPSADQLRTYSPDQLLAILEAQIKQLQSENQSTRLLELLKSSGIKEDLLKAIQLGKEYQANFLYYKK
jgi:hypothetical protein